MRTLFSSLRTLSFIVLALLVTALLYVGWIALQNWHGITV